MNVLANILKMIEALKSKREDTCDQHQDGFGTTHTKVLPVCDEEKDHFWKPVRVVVERT